MTTSAATGSTLSIASRLAILLAAITAAAFVLLALLIPLGLAFFSSVQSP